MATAEPLTNLQPEFRGQIYESIVDTIGATPLVRIRPLAEEEGCHANLVTKLEFFNPLASVKDRIGLAMITAAEATGQVGPGSVIVEPTSGNTGIALAFVAAARGYRCILVMPDPTSHERRKMLLLLGAELVMTPAADGINGSIVRAKEIVADTPNTFMPQQFENPANPQIHRQTTAEEVWNDTDGKVNVVVAGVGTGGTLAGVGQILKARKPEVKMIAVEPEDSSVLSGGPPEPHKIQGIGAGFIPGILDIDLTDEILPIANESTMAMVRRAAQVEGLPCGISTGAVLTAALEVGARPKMMSKLVVAVLPSFAERYLLIAVFEGL
jgi:cysteine synthase A